MFADFFSSTATTTDSYERERVREIVKEGGRDETNEVRDVEDE